MKNSISKIIVTITLLFSFAISNAQIKNAKTETVKIYGNCGMCEKTIEKAGNLKKVAIVDWNKDTKMATLTYDAKKTNQDEILKRIALAGYDSDKFLAPEKAYNDLAGCCQYDREAKVPIKSEVVAENNENKTEKIKTEVKDADQLKAVFDNYFAIKNALVKTDGAIASTKSAALLSAINDVKMEKLEMDVHSNWMKVVADLKEDAKKIAETNDTKTQRDNFDSLSENIYKLIKASKQEFPIYYQHCPMANGGKGANWLSKENEIKNPYYGSQMLSCGKTLETLK